MAAVGWTAPKPSVPPTPRHSCQDSQPGLGKHTAWSEPCSLQPSPQDGHTAPPTAGAIVPSTPHSAATDLHPSPEPANSPEYRPVTPSSVKLSEVPTTYTTSTETPFNTHEIDGNHPWNRYKQAYFNGLIQIPSCGLDTGPGSLFSVKSNVNRDQWRGSHDLGLPNLPALS